MSLSCMCLVSQQGKWLSSARTDFIRIHCFTRTVWLPDLNRQHGTEWWHHCHCPSFCSKAATVLFAEAEKLKKKGSTHRVVSFKVLKSKPSFSPKKENKITVQIALPSPLWHIVGYCVLPGCDISQYGRWSPCSCRLQIADDVSAMTWAEEQKRAYECKTQRFWLWYWIHASKGKGTVFSLWVLTLRLQVWASPVIKDVTCITNVARMPFNTEL